MNISHRKILLMILFGSVLETYDYSLYGYFAYVFAKAFFPSNNSTAALLLVFTVFALGFLTRPIGAIIFGYVGDKYGRKKNLMISIMLMAIPTTIIGCLPTYAAIGIAAPLLLMLCRLTQGLAIGAEYAGTMVYLIEFAPRTKQTFYGSLGMMTGYIALFITSILIIALTYFIPTDTLNTWGWRILFLAGILLGFVGLYIRRHLPETPAFLKWQAKESKAINPILSLLAHPLSLVQGISLVALHACGFYLVFVFMLSYMQQYYQISMMHLTVINTIAVLCAIFFVPMVGVWAEKINKKNMIILSCVGTIVCAYPFFLLLQLHTFLLILAIQVLFTLLLCMTTALIPAMLVEMFPVEFRYSGVALCYNIGGVIFGGTTPLILTFMIEKTNNLTSPAIYLMLMASITLCATLSIKKQARLVTSTESATAVSH